MDDPKYDAHGQPTNQAYGFQRIADTEITELIGISRGILADGLVNLDEANYLLHWLENNRHCADTWPANVLYQRLSEFLLDGKLDPEEQSELLIMLGEVTGGALPSSTEGRSHSTTLDMDYPDIIIMVDKKISITGKFYTGPRKKIVSIIESHGGTWNKTVNSKVTYLLVGEVGSRDWIQSTHGRKIETAFSYKRDGYPIQIIPERHWITSMRP